MPEVLAPPAPAKPVPSPRTAPPIKESPPKPVVEHPASVDPTPEIPDDQNPFFAIEKKMGMADDEPEQPSTPEEITEPEDKLEEKAPEPNKEQDEAKPKDNDKDARTIKPKTEGGKLREERDRIAKELEEVRKSKEELEAKLANPEKAEEVTKLTERLAAIEKERDDARSEVMMLKQEVSPEFKKQYEEPFNREANRAAVALKQLLVTSEDGTTRPGNWETDFTAIYNLPYAEAADKAEALFGKHASRVMKYYDTLHDLDDNYKEALTREKATWKETAAKKTAEETKQREAFTAAFAKAKEALTKKYSDRFADDPNDAEATKWLAEGRKMLEKPATTFQEHVAKAAAMELAVVAHPRLVYTISKLTKERDAALAKLKEYEASEPGPTTRKTPTPETGEADEMSELRNLLNTK